MTTLTIAIPDESRAFIDREVAAGKFKDCDALVLAALNEFMRSQWKANADKMITEALDEYDRGENTEWQPGDCLKRGIDYLDAKRKHEGKV